ncbi:MAG: vWA domain-containing protein, partial [Candidatus Jordarchaeaceae archaeon]
SNRTVPIRFGSEEFQAYGGVGLADAVLITDVSGSMDTSDVICDKSWEITTTHYQGAYGARNKDISHNQHACIYRNITLISDGNISFWWRVSSQANSDYLLFCADLPTCSLTTYTRRISGTGGGWQNINISLTAGTHEIRWCYAKDGSGSSGSDVGYIDLIMVNDSRGTFFLENFEDTMLDGWYFSSNVASFNCERLEVAKDVDFVFVDTVLNVSGNRVGLVNYSTSVSSTHPISNNSATLKGNITQYTAGGCTCISCGINRAIQMLNAVAEPRFKGILVMSDGYANKCILGDAKCQFGPNPNPYCPNNQSRDYPPKLEAINMSCEARRLNYTIFSVAFGSEADKETLQKIACWNCSACPPNANPSNPNCWIQTVTLPNGGTANCLDVRYGESSNYEELRKIYKQFAEYFAGAYVTQKINVTGEVFKGNYLYPDSYIEFYYEPEVKEEYGEISLKVETNPFGCNGTFFVPQQVKVLDITRTSYSSDFWSRRVYVNNSVYNWNITWSLDYFGSNYVYLGDPFSIQFSPSYIKSGENNTVGLVLGLGPTNTSGICSSRDRVIYTGSFKSFTTYSPVFPYIEGRNITVYYDKDHNGAADGSYAVTIGRNLPKFNATLGIVQDLNVTHNAVDYAFLKLLDQLNFLTDQPLPEDPLSINKDLWPGTEDNPIDIMITPDILFETLFVAAVPSLWGPTNLEIKVWV